MSGKVRKRRNEEERTAIRQLRVLDALARFHESVREGDSTADLSASISVARSVVDPVRLGPANATPATSSS